MLKHFHIAKEHRLELRWEVFNLPNHVNLYLLETQIDVPAAGTITRAYAPRQMQLAVRYIF